ncbi:NAD(P)-binding domain-containing protein, partial [Anaerospora hongkongensis]|uniref:NAD(P)-binding domain-containing protein n=1 Tax=Anaerospora hongkongensis TaxID=244830 RepID=UPI002FD8E1D4
MAKLYYDLDANWDVIQDKKIAVIGYGSQGHAHALNMHDYGLDVTVGLYEGSKSWDKAQSDGLKVAVVSEAVASADVIMILIPDEKQAQVYCDSIAPNLKAG